MRIEEDDKKEDWRLFSIDGDGLCNHMIGGGHVLKRVAGHIVCPRSGERVKAGVNGKINFCDCDIGLF